jgi:cysteine sulfinate desulfinase/cysteine desulfurase-like protein
MVAMGVEKALANSLVRFSFGCDSNIEDLMIAEKAFENVINRARRP